MKRRALILAFSLIASLGTIAGCGNSEGGDSDTQKVVMATSADYPPYEFYETAKGEGKPVGFDIDIATYITDELGYELEVKDMDFNGIIPALQSKRVDFAMSGMTPTEERKQSVDFSSIYYDAKNTIVAATGSDYKSYQDLTGKKVGVQLGTTQQEEAKTKAEEIGDITIEPRNKVSDLIQEVKAGRIDAAIIEDTVAKGYINTNPDLAFTPIEESGELSGSAIAFPKDSELTEKFENVLQEMKENGELEKLVKKWFEDYYEEQDSAE
ncbi:MAG: transporter substrate-binding domain-containing protein [Cyanobacteria bacterium SBLK]|nr:transporter substrate-binding domain-containing protein [Cyanobacteria bacterium SBLK]